MQYRSEHKIEQTMELEWNSGADTQSRTGKEIHCVLILQHWLILGMDV